ncbi:hypothetical protein OC481_004737 [Escherichia coli]|nr:hypothetical protein [Escherichia coli]
MNSIPLSEFSGIHSFGHARLYIKTSDSGTQTVVSEKLGPRIRTRLEKLPLLRNRESVQERRIAAAREDSYTRGTFQEALKQVYGDSFSRQAMQDIAGKPLTRRMVRQIIHNAEKVKVGGDKEEQKLSLSDKASEFTKIAYDTSLNQLGLFVQKVKMITGSELKNIETLATGNDCLRSLMTAAHGVAQFSGNADITKAVETLLDIRVGNIPFSQFGTCTTAEGSAVQWIQNASQDDLEKAAEVIRRVAGDLELLFQNIKNGQSKVSSTLSETIKPNSTGERGQTNVTTETARHWGRVVNEFRAIRR